MILSNLCNAIKIKVEKMYCAPLSFEPISILVPSTRFYLHISLSFLTFRYLEPNKVRHLRYVGIISRCWIPISVTKNTKVGTLAESRFHWKGISHLHTNCWYVHSNFRKSRRSLLTVYIILWIDWWHQKLRGTVKGEHKKEDWKQRKKTRLESGS